TGATGGIGRAICLRAIRAGRPLIPCGRDREALDELVVELTAARSDAGDGSAPAIVPLAFDVTDEECMQSELMRVHQELGAPIDIVLNAGVAISAPLTRKDGERDLFALHMDVNFHGPRRLVELLIPGMADACHGRVVAIASSAGLRGYSYVAAYSASKHALLGFIRSASLELEAKGIGCSAICPHYVDSPMTDASVARVARKTGQSLAAARAYFAAENPGGQLVRPDEVAQATLEQLDAQQTGEVLELLGGGRRIVDAPRALSVVTPAQFERRS
ncbi:MAG: 3-hydroxybutyrate dehydrogenase, partial [Planctomycetota bacterium]